MCCQKSYCKLIFDLCCHARFRSVLFNTKDLLGDKYLLNLNLMYTLHIISALSIYSRANAN